MSVENKDRAHLSRINAILDEWTNYLENVWSVRRKEWIENWHNYNSRYRKRYYNGRAQIFVPLSFQLVESFVPQIYKSLFPTDPAFDLKPVDRKSTRLNSSHSQQSRMPSSA